MSVVSEAMRTFQDYMHGGDSTVRSWFLLKDFKNPLMISISYVLFVKVIGPAYMRNKKPYDLRIPMILYNFGLVGFYFYFLVRGFFLIYSLGPTFYCKFLNQLPAFNVQEFLILGWQMYLVRFLELIDTIFLVLRKKFYSITNLHLIHHAIVPLLCFLILRSELSTYITVFCGANGTVHLFMYSYYGIAALGPKYQKYLWWKKYLTTMQILQFVVITMYLLMTIYYGCATSKSTVYIYTFVSVFFLFLFMNYYRKTFSQKQSMSDKSAKSCNGNASNHAKTCNGSSSNHDHSNGTPPISNGVHSHNKEE